MSDWHDAASTSASGAPAGGRAEPRGVFGEFLDAARAAVIAMLDEQKERAADRVAALGEAVSRAGQSLDSSQTPTIARYASRTAAQIDGFSAGIRERSWQEISDDTAAFAQRRPAVFFAAAAALGFLAGRLAAAPAHRGPAAPAAQPAVTPMPAGFAAPAAERAAAARTAPGTPPDVP
jgi:cell division septum initiation protein DivIVA